MGRDKRLPGDFAQFPEPSVIQVGDIYDDPRLFHPLHSLPPKRSKPLIGLLPAAKLIRPVPHKRHHLNAVCRKIVHIIKRSRKSRAALNRQYHRTSAFRSDPFNIPRRTYQLRHLTLLPKKHIQIFLMITEILNRLFTPDIIRNENCHRLTQPIKLINLLQRKLRLPTQEIRLFFLIVNDRITMQIKKLQTTTPFQ